MTGDESPLAERKHAEMENRNGLVHWRRYRVQHSKAFCSGSFEGATPPLPLPLVVMSQKELIVCALRCLPSSSEGVRKHVLSFTLIGWSFRELQNFGNFLDHTLHQKENMGLVLRPLFFTSECVKMVALLHFIFYPFYILSYHRY